jgi:hypothetical protein
MLIDQRIIKNMQQENNVVKYTCNCVLSYPKYDIKVEKDIINYVSTPAICREHNQPIMFVAPHKYKGNFTVVAHPTTDGFLFAIHQCKKDQFGFITELNKTPLTELVELPKNIEITKFESLPLDLTNIMPENESKIMLNDLCCNLSSFPTNLLV